MALYDPRLERTLGECAPVRNPLISEYGTMHPVSPSHGHMSAMIDPVLRSQEPIRPAELEGLARETHQMHHYMTNPEPSFIAGSSLSQAYQSCPRTFSPTGHHSFAFSGPYHPRSPKSDSFGTLTESDSMPVTPPDSSDPCSMLTDPFPELPGAHGHSLLYMHGGQEYSQKIPYVDPLGVNASQQGPNVFGIKHDEPNTFSFDCNANDYTGEVCASLFQSSLPAPRSDTVAETGKAGASRPLDEMESLKSEEDDDSKDWLRSNDCSNKRIREESSQATQSSGEQGPSAKRPRTGSNAPSLSVSSHGDSKFPCRDCHVSFRNEHDLQKHKRVKHTRPFICIFNFAGCTSSFPSKNEWKRHVLTQHLALNFWLCTQDGCGHAPLPPPATLSKKNSCRSATQEITRVDGLSSGVVFNRKDLYTQHVRRMHLTPLHTKGDQTSAHDARLETLQTDAEMRRCDLPKHMSCPVQDCTAEFRGSDAWDNRMEHVAKHLENAAEGREAMVHFGGSHDPSLTKWAERKEVSVIQKTGAHQWELLDPLKCTSGLARGGRKGIRRARPGSQVNKLSAAVVTIKQEELSSGNEEDAEGEEDY